MEAEHGFFKIANQFMSKKIKVLMVFDVTTTGLSWRWHTWNWHHNYPGMNDVAHPMLLMHSGAVHWNAEATNPATKGFFRHGQQAWLKATQGTMRSDIWRMVDAFVEYEQIRLPYVFDPNEHSYMLLMRTQSSHQPNCKTTWVGMLMATTHNIKHPVTTLPSPS